jgi:hypothetical protein
MRTPNVPPVEKRFQSETLEVVYEKVVGDPRRQADLEQEVINVEAAQLIYDMRTKGARQALAMVRRIAAALNRRLEPRAIPIRARRRGERR